MNKAILRRSKALLSLGNMFALLMGLNGRQWVVLRGYIGIHCKFLYVCCGVLWQIAGIQGNFQVVITVYIGVFAVYHFILPFIHK